MDKQELDHDWDHFPCSSYKHRPLNSPVLVNCWLYKCDLSWSFSIMLFLPGYLHNNFLEDIYIIIANMFIFPDGRYKSGIIHIHPLFLLFYHDRSRYQRSQWTVQMRAVNTHWIPLYCSAMKLCIFFLSPTRRFFWIRGLIKSWLSDRYNIKNKAPDFFPSFVV